jgi:hypothetical protein
MKTNKRPTGVWISAIVAILFGLLTIKSGGSVLFTDGEARLAAGNYVDFVLWSNFLAGFFYVATGIGIWLQKPWSATAAIIIAVLTALIFAALGVYIINGGESEQRTTIAMALRTLVWTVIAITSWHRLSDHASESESH